MSAQNICNPQRETLGEPSAQNICKPSAQKNICEPENRKIFRDCRKIHKLFTPFTQFRKICGVCSESCNGFLPARCVYSPSLYDMRSGKLPVARCFSPSAAHGFPVRMFFSHGKRFSPLQFPPGNCFPCREPDRETFFLCHFPPRRKKNFFPRTKKCIVLCIAISFSMRYNTPRIQIH